MQDTLLEAMKVGVPEGVTCLPKGKGFAAHTHIGGGPRCATQSMPQVNRGCKARA